MTFHPRYAARLAASTLAGSLAFAGSAFALDADDFTTKLAAALGQGGARLSYAAADQSGDTLVMKSVRMTVPGNPPLDAGDITFTGIEESGDGGYVVDEVAFEDIRFGAGPDEGVVEDLKINGMIVPADATSDTLEHVMFYDKVSTGPIRVGSAGNEFFSMTGTAIEMKRTDDDSIVGITATGSGMKLDVNSAGDPKMRKMLTDLGYTELTGRLTMDGVWEAEPGTVTIRDYSIDLDNVGRLALSAKVSGYTLELVKALQEAQAAAAANPDQQAAQQALGFAMLGLTQQLSLNWASIGFEDDSLTGRALDYAGKQQGVSGDQMAMAMKGMLPLMLGQLGVPALQQQISAAANVYLDNPGNLTITARPAQPVPLPQIMGAGMGDPRALVDLLNVEVSANAPTLLCCKE